VSAIPFTATAPPCVEVSIVHAFPALSVIVPPAVIEVPEGVAKTIKTNEKNKQKTNKKQTKKELKKEKGKRELSCTYVCIKRK
jgi:hypothetical protein